MRSVPSTGPIGLGIIYPLEWAGGEAGLTPTIERISAIEPRIEVVIQPYEEGQAMRTLRGRPEHYAEARAQAPALSDAQRAMFERVHAVVAIDLPFDVGSVAPNLAWVQAVGAGTAQLQSAGLADDGILLTSAAGANAVAIAEFVIGRILEERKRFREIAALAAKHEWDPLYGTELAGATVGLIGYGAIASAVAKRLAGFDVQVLATRRSAKPGDTAPFVDELFPTSALHDMLARCDTVVAAVPETPETIGLMNAAAFAAMPAGAFFVNVGRGTLVDEPALIDALERGHLRGAALDVASAEPLPPEHPLWSAPNVTISAHCSAAPSALFVNLNRLLVDQIRRWLAGDPLVNVVG